MAAENTWGILQQHLMVWPTLRHQHVSRDSAVVLQRKQHLSLRVTGRWSNEGPGKRITTMVPLKARHRLCRRTKRTGRRGVEREAGADKVLTMMVSAEHHCADGNQNEAVIGDKLMYGVSDPEPGILIQEQTETHTHTHMAGRTAGFWSESMFQSSRLHAVRHKMPFIISVHELANSYSSSYLDWPVRQAHRPWPSAASPHNQPPAISSLIGSVARMWLQQAYLFT